MKRVIIPRNTKSEIIDKNNAQEIMNCGDVMEKIRQEAFVEGYKYAIHVLEDGLIKRKKTK